MKSLALIAVIFLTAVNAASVTFKVIVPSNPSSVQVKIGSKLVNLKAYDPDIPYFTGVADYELGSEYRYVADGTPESFGRKLSSGSSTMNDIYSREITYANLPEIPKVLREGAWTKGSVDHPIWDQNYITSIFITGDPNEMNNLIENVALTYYKVKITFIGPNDVYTFRDCTFGIHKPGRKSNDAKQSWVWSLPAGKFLADRNWFKLRHMEEDPTQLREKLYADVARAMGTYANAANMIRFFINNEGMGTFNLLDDVIMYSYINAMFYGGRPPNKMGGLFDGASGADFSLASDIYSFIPNVESPLEPDALTSFTKAFSEIDYSNDAEVESISQFFDYDQFLRFMVLEYLTGSWDGYWQQQTNDGAYIEMNHDPVKLYYLAQDFDAAFGVNLPFGPEFVNVPYTEFPAKFPKGFLINKLLTNKKVRQTFARYVKTVYTQILNKNTLQPILEARHAFYAPDLRWDRSIRQRSPGNVFGWTLQQTKDNIYQGVTAPNGGGGAGFGILEWVGAMEKTCDRLFASGNSENIRSLSAQMNNDGIVTSSTTETVVPRVLLALTIISIVAIYL